MSTKERAFELLQTTYYDSIDRGDMATAASAMHPDVEWSHQQVWEHHQFKREGSAVTINGKAAVEELLSARVGELKEAKIQHKIREMVFEDGKGAFLAAVEGDGPDKPFMVWFEIRDDLIARYLLRPL